MKSRSKLLRIVVPLIVVVADIKFLQHKFSTIPFLLLIVALGYLTVTVIVGFIRRGKNTKYERKPQSPWGALNEGIDPTL